MNAIAEINAARLRFGSKLRIAARGHGGCTVETIEAHLAEDAGTVVVVADLEGVSGYETITEGFPMTAAGWNAQLQHHVVQLFQGTACLVLKGHA